MIDQSFWKNKKVFLTGHTGFKGSWLSIWLNKLGAKVRGYSLSPNTNPSLFDESKVENIVESIIGDIRDLAKLTSAMNSFEPEIIIHMAAQPLVRYSYEFPIETYEVNVIGTANILESARSCNSVKAIINITTDKCYENDDRKAGYRENDPMGGFDPYSSSKGCAELVASSYYRSFFKNKKVGLASVRAGNVIGGGDWAKDRLFPDILKSFSSKEQLIIRNPNSVRPWQHVLEPLSGYILLAQKLFYKPEEFSGGWNFGPEDKSTKSVKQILDMVSYIRPDVSWILDNIHGPHEAEYLRLDITKAREKLNWTPVWNIELTIRNILSWHDAWVKNDETYNLCDIEISKYMKDMKK